MFSKGKGLSQMPSEIQAKEKLVMYVYEYLINSGAKTSAQTFLNEIRWDKHIQISNEQPGFLISWWSVFWDLYCASTPDRREGEPTNEAKMFHDFTQNSQPPQLGNNNMIGHGPNPPFQRFHSGGPPQGPRPVRMPLNIEYNNGNPNNNQMNNDQSRVPPGMQSPLSRLTPPGRMNQQPQQPLPAQVGPPSNQMNQFNGQGPNQMRVPSQQVNPNQPQPPNQQQMSNPPMSPMSMNLQQQQQQRWTATPNSQGQTLAPPPPPPPHNMAYNSSSPVPYGNVSLNHHGGPGTPGLPIPSPQEQNPDLNFNMIKNVGNNIQFHDQQMGHMVPLNAEVSHHSHISNEIMDSIKHSPLPNLAGNRMNPEDHSVGGQVVGGQVVGQGGPPPQMNDLNSYNNFADGVNFI